MSTEITYETFDILIEIEYLTNGNDNYILVIWKKKL